MLSGAPQTNPDKLGKGKNMRKLKPLPNRYIISLKGQSLRAERISKMPTNPEIPAQTLSR